MQLFTRSKVAWASFDAKCNQKGYPLSDKAETSSCIRSSLEGNDAPVDCFRRNSPKRAGEYQLELELQLHCFAAMGDVSRVTKLVEDGVAVNARDYNGRTALHQAVQKGHVAVVKYLLSKGAEVDCRDDSGTQPLSLAQHGRHYDVQNVLRMAGATSAVHSPELRDQHSNLAKFAIIEAFPRPIARCMLEGRKIEQICKDNVSVFFSDIVGFAAMRSDMDSQKVSRMLSALIKRLDKLAYQHGVQKVDVIGDAYVAATNFTEDQPQDHAARIARFAIDARKAARETCIDEDNPEHFECVQLRIGLHCGAVSGGVVGWQNFKYTLLGDTVNTASRMESTCAPGRIQCSEVMASLIAQQSHEMIVKPRSFGVNIKGKGHMDTFWLSSLREGLQTFGSCPQITRPRLMHHSLDDQSQLFRKGCD